MVTKEFLLLIVVSTVFAVPVSWFSMSQWLQDFAYRVPVGAGAFLASGAIALGIAAATVGLRAFKAASANTVKALRSE